ncbi:MAG: Sec-independent protein translocase subunit TatA [Pseudomonadota bacterium]
MGGFSLMHWLLFGGVAILVLGGGRFSNMMGDVAKGIKQFKKGMAEEDAAPPTRIEGKRVDPATDPDADR